ncbi:MAG: DUF4150 domain-containing protein [Pseudomonadales bacterium]|nr:DUF4150 domain-containing protein [Pseudomonadales bacterium]
MGNTTLVNGKSPVTKGSGGTVIAAPDICKTPTPGGPVPIPYPNISKSSDLAKGSKKVMIDGHPVCLSTSNFSTSTGNEAGTAGGGVASSKTKGIAEPILYSFDVKINGKPVVRNNDLFLANNKNTPPAVLMQGQIAAFAAVFASAEEIVPAKCEFCGEDEHTFSSKKGTNNGSGTLLANSIFKGSKKQDHPWYSGGWSLEAHHIICSESMDSDDWYEFSRNFGYSINHENNGVMLPGQMDLACQLHVPVHRGNHSKGWADDVHLPYPKAVKKKLRDIRAAAEQGEYCSDPEAMAEELDDISEDILLKISSFTWTISTDGKDYMQGGQGCADVKSISDKPQANCKHQRQHQLTQKKTKKVIPVHSGNLELGT